MDDSKKMLGYWRDYHSFFDDLVTMLISLSSNMFTLRCMILSNHPQKFNKRSLQEWISYIRPLKDFEYPFSLEEISTESFLVFYPASIITHIGLNGWPDVIKFLSLPANDAPKTFSINSHENLNIQSRLVGASFVNYYASQVERIELKYGEPNDNWPPQINFARHVRNGFAHGGSFNISNPNTPIVCWRNWKIDYQKNGKQVLFGENGLGIGDVIRLMEDVDVLFH